jgi:uncharacterized protein YdeI (YjbR/CyaY-like superfamily)
LEQWLEENHDSVQGIWLKIAKKSSKQTSISYAEAIDVALCFGWIDGQKGKLDDDFWIQKFTPRRKNSPWSRINRDKATILITQSKMRPSGLKEVERAKADGRWDKAYASQSQITIPEDFQVELDKNPDAQAFFDQLNSANRYAFLYRITTAKKAETRQKRIDKFIAMLNAQEKFH